jgi:hypothetical protein
MVFIYQFANLQIQVGRPAAAEILLTSEMTDINSLAWEKVNILTENKLKERLGDNSRWDLTRQTTVGAVATRRDPICRFL